MMPNLQETAINGPWNRAQVGAFLRDAIIPVRLAVLSGNAWPLVASLWFFADEDALWCATSQRALIVQHLQGDARCGFEIAGDTPPYKGIRGQGRASCDPDRGASVLRALLARYAIQPDSRLSRMLLAKVHEETAIRIEPEWITSWDFTQRMAGATAGAQGNPGN